MPMETPTKPVSDTVAKVNNELAVGADLNFQRRWWRFERLVWIFFATILVLDLTGAFGKGPLAKGYRATKDGTVTLHYERVERFSAPSILTINFGVRAIKGGKVSFWVSEDLVKRLGNERVIPQPINSVIGGGGITYTFPTTVNPASVEFQLQPTSIGLQHLTFRAAEFEPIELKIFVMP